MDDIFEQMLSSSSPWGGDAASATNPSLLGGSLEMSRSALYEDDGRLPGEVLMFGDAGHLHALQAPPLWNQTYVGALSPSSSSATHGLLGCGKQEAFLGDPLRDLHLGKRPREGDDIIDGQPNVGIQGFGDQGATLNGGGKPRVRARRGQATDPHSIAERNRRERIAERMKALQELVPDSNKTDKASMLDEIIGYVKFLQMQVKCLSMCRLGGAGATAPLLSDLSAEGGNFAAAAANMPPGNGGGAGDGITLAEHQVAKLMDEDMSAAMQYLQSKGLCLMPISLATVISSSGTSRNPQSSGIGPSIGPSDGAESMKQAMELAASFAASVGATTQTAASMMGSLSSSTNSFLSRKDAANAPNQRSDASDDGDDADDDDDKDGLNNLKRPSIPSLHNRTSKGIRIRQDLQR